MRGGGKEGEKEGRGEEEDRRGRKKDRMKRDEYTCIYAAAHLRDSYSHKCCTHKFATGLGDTVY